MTKLWFFTMHHRGGLDEALKTIKVIDEKKFNELLVHYDFYCFDDRILSIRFILKDMEHDYKLYPEWLLISFKDVPDVFGDDPFDKK